MSNSRPYPSKPTSNFPSTTHRRGRIARLKASSKNEKTHEKLLSKLTVISSPKFPTRISSNSPLNLSPQKSPASKSPNLNSRKIIIKTSEKVKIQSSNEETPSNISPIGSFTQELPSFLNDLLDRFSDADVISDYFYLDRENALSSSNFIESCLSLGLSDSKKLLKIFQELASEGNLTKSNFFQKVLNFQNEKSRKKLLQNREVEKFFSKKRVKSNPKERTGNLLQKNIENFEILIRRRKSSSKQVFERSLVKEKKLLNMSLRITRSTNPIFHKFSSKNSQ